MALREVDIDLYKALTPIDGMLENARRIESSLSEYPRLEKKAQKVIDALIDLNDTVAQRVRR